MWNYLKNDMKARVIRTGEIVTVEQSFRYPYGYVASNGNVYQEEDLARVVEESPDYWTRLEHQYAGMAMQGMLNNGTLLSIVLKGLSHEEFVKEIAKAASNYAHALVEKIKEERE